MGYSPQKKPFDLKDFLSKAGTRRPSRMNTRYGKGPKETVAEPAPEPLTKDPEADDES